MLCQKIQVSLRPLNLILRDNKYSTLFPGFSPTCPTEPLGTRLIIIKCALSVVIKCVNILQHLVFVVCITISLYAALSYSFLNTRVRRKSAINTPNRDNKCPRLFHMGVTPPQLQGFAWENLVLERWLLIRVGCTGSFKCTCTFVVQILVSKPSLTSQSKYFLDQTQLSLTQKRCLAYERLDIERVSSTL